MEQKLNYLECWTQVATSLFAQALAGEPVLTEALPKPMGSGGFGFAATLEGEEEGRFAVWLEGGLAEATLLGEGTDQRAGWEELLKETCEAAIGELLAKTGRKSRILNFVPTDGENKLSRAFQLKAGERSWSVVVNSSVKLAKVGTAPAVAKGAGKEKEAPRSAAAPGPSRPNGDGYAGREAPGYGSGSAGISGLSPGLELLLDVELEASLRFGAREMPLSEILDLGPGDVVQLDRHIQDPVDLIVGDKIIARGEVVLVNGNFGLRVLEVAEPQRRLESIRCLF